MNLHRETCAKEDVTAGQGRRLIGDVQVLDPRVCGFDINAFCAEVIDVELEFRDIRVHLSSTRRYGLNGIVQGLDRVFGAIRSTDVRAIDSECGRALLFQFNVICLPIGPNDCFYGGVFEHLGSIEAGVVGRVVDELLELVEFLRNRAALVVIERAVRRALSQLTHARERALG